MQTFEPIGLRSGQYGLVAAVTIIAAWIPNLSSIAPVTHVVEMDIEVKTGKLGNHSLTVAVLETGEVNANGKPVTLYQLSMLADKLKAKDDSVVLNPDPCAPYDMVIKTIAALKRSGPSHLGFVEPDYSTSFGKASGYPGDASFKSSRSDECSSKAFSDRK